MQQSTEPESQQHKDYGPRTLGRDPKYSPVTAEKHREQEEEANLDPLIYNQLGWTYVGHGDWDTSEDTHPPQHGCKPEKDPEWIYKWRCNNDEDIRLHQEVWDKGYPNRWGARWPVKTKWNLALFEELLCDYEDKEVIEWMKYGWPSGRLPALGDPGISNSNHKGATEYPAALRQYIEKEKGHGAVMGPYARIPFQGKVGIAPLSTRPKKDSQERRVILDLSFPRGNSVNDGMTKDTYLGFEAKLTFPKVDDFAFRIFTLGHNCMMFKVDLSQYFRQLPLDPGDYSLIGYIIEGEIYFDKVLPMGMRSAPYIAQRVTNAIAYIHRQLQYYVDDFVGAETRQRVWQAYKALTTLLRDLRVDTSADKLVPPTTRLEFLGITFDSTTQTMEISEQKMTDITRELDTWMYRTTANRREVESLIGKLQFLAKCIRAGRVFLSRLINWIRGMRQHGTYPIPPEARKDIAWWNRCAQQYNGISLIWLIKEPHTDTIITTDACLTGYRGTGQGEYFRGRFPQELIGRNIAYLEILAVMVALKIWGPRLRGKYFWIHVDNEAVASVLNTGASRDSTLQDTLREIALIAAKYQFVIKAKHISGVSNRVPDWLSRWDEPEAKKAFREYSKDSGIKRIKISNLLLQFENKW